MYSNYNMPNYRTNMPRRGFNRNDRFIGGGFIAPFLLGGITGGLLARPNNFGGNYYAPYPYPVPVPYPYNNNYSTYPTYTENYYYY